MPLPPFIISPPLLNSSNPWATTASDLLSLYDSPHTGAVTIRTSLLDGYTQHPSTHQYTFFSSSKGYADSKIISASTGEGRGAVLPDETSSLNTLGYSPIPLTEYLNILRHFAQGGKLTRRDPEKPFIVSVTGPADDVAECYILLVKISRERLPGLSLMMEVNLSCPNIVDRPPPAYDGTALATYILSLAIAKERLRTAATMDEQREGDIKSDVHIGIKTPPYTYEDQFRTLISCLERPLPASSIGNPPRVQLPCPISFITSTNTLGSCLVLSSNPPDTFSAPPSSSNLRPALGSSSKTGLGGLAGAALHPLSLGNVQTIRSLLSKSSDPDVRSIQIIGTGGVADGDGWRRMRYAGASAVGVGTALGRQGVDVFQGIVRHVTGDGEFEFKRFGEAEG